MKRFELGFAFALGVWSEVVDSGGLVGRYPVAYMYTRKCLLG